MAGYANLIEEAMQLIDYGCHLLRQVSGIHVEKAASSVLECQFYHATNAQSFAIGSSSEECAML